MFGIGREGMSVSFSTPWHFGKLFPFRAASIASIHKLGSRKFLVDSGWVVPLKSVKPSAIC